MANTVTFNRMKGALKDLLNYKENMVAGRLKNVLLGNEEPSFSNGNQDFVPVNKYLNESQIESIKFALSASGMMKFLGIFIIFMYRPCINSWSSWNW